MRRRSLLASLPTVGVLDGLAYAINWRLVGSDE